MLAVQCEGVYICLYVCLYVCMYINVSEQLVQTKHVPTRMMRQSRGGGAVARLRRPSPSAPLHAAHPPSTSSRDQRKRELSCVKFVIVIIVNENND